jgi:hypothetical protein
MGRWAMVAGVFSVLMIVVLLILGSYSHNERALRHWCDHWSVVSSSSLLDGSGEAELLRPMMNSRSIRYLNGKMTNESITEAQGATLALAYIWEGSHVESERFGKLAEFVDIQQLREKAGEFVLKANIAAVRSTLAGWLDRDQQRRTAVRSNGVTHQR